MSHKRETQLSVRKKHYAQTQHPGLIDITHEFKKGWSYLTRGWGGKVSGQALTVKQIVNKLSDEASQAAIIETYSLAETILRVSWASLDNISKATSTDEVYKNIATIRSVLSWKSEYKSSLQKSTDSLKRLQLPDEYQDSLCLLTDEVDKILKKMEKLESKIDSLNRSFRARSKNKIKMPFQFSDDFTDVRFSPCPRFKKGKRFQLSILQGRIIATLYDNAMKFDNSNDVLFMRKKSVIGQAAENSSSRWADAFRGKDDAYKALIEDDASGSMVRLKL